MVKNKWNEYMARPKSQLNRKKEILDTAQYLFSEKGFDKTTIQEIADSIGIGKGTIYLDFKNKDEIYIAIVERYLVDAIERLKVRINLCKSNYLSLLKELLITHPLEVYDMAIFNNQTYAAIAHTSTKIKHKLKHLIFDWNCLIAEILEKAAINNEIKPYHSYMELADVLKSTFMAYFPPYAMKYSPEHRSDITKTQIRDLLKNDIYLTVKVIISGLQSIDYETNTE